MTPGLRISLFTRPAGCRTSRASSGAFRASRCQPKTYTPVTDPVHAEWSASAVGVYRLWRDTGYAVGALIAGVLADLLGVSSAIGAVAALTFASGAVVLGRMYETLPSKRLTGSELVVEGSFTA